MIRSLLPGGTRPAWARRRSVRYARRGVAGVAVLAAAALVGMVSVDLGPAVRARAERGLAGYLDREVGIGRVGIYLLRGQFVVEDLTIGGLNPGDRPFLTAERITLSVVWPALLRGEFLADEVLMRDWEMLAESFPDGRQSFPAFVRQGGGETAAGGDDEPAPPAAAAPDAEAGRRFVTTLQYLHASRGAFRFEDHGSNWSVSLPDVDFTITRVLDYRGRAAASGGVLRIADFEPMRVDLETDFLLDGADVHLTRIDLETDGAATRLEGDVDLSNFPEMSYTLESDVDLTRMREIFFADDDFTASGLARFSGAFHKFEGGHDLRGSFTSAAAGVDALRFPALAGDLVWRHDRFEVRNVEAAPYGGKAEFDFSMAPLGAAGPGQAAFDVRYDGVGLGALARDLEVRGIRPRGRASGRNRLDWPIGRFADFRAAGDVRLEPPAGVRLAGPEPDPGAAAAVAGRRGQSPDLTTRTFPLGGQVEYRATSGGLELGAGTLATPSTHVAFGGTTAWGADTRISFEVSSANWQESDRLMAAVMTAAGFADEPVRRRRLGRPRRRPPRGPVVAAHRGGLRRRGRAGLGRRVGRRPRRVRGRGLVPGRHRGGFPPRRRRARDRRAVLPALAPARRRRGNERGRAARVVSGGRHPGRFRAPRGLSHRGAGHRRDAALRRLSAALRGWGGCGSTGPPPTANRSTPPPPTCVSRAPGSG